MVTNVFAGNFGLDRQLNAARYVRPVSSATAFVPPSASMTSDVLLRVRIEREQYQSNFDIARVKMLWIASK
jgi:hypothetical protein